MPYGTNGYNMGTNFLYLAKSMDCGNILFSVQGPIKRL